MLLCLEASESTDGFPVQQQTGGSPEASVRVNRQLMPLQTSTPVLRNSDLSFDYCNISVLWAVTEPLLKALI